MVIKTQRGEITTNDGLSLEAGPALHHCQLDLKDALITEAALSAPHYVHPQFPCTCYTSVAREQGKHLPAR